MRVTALQSDVLVFVSDVWQTTCTAVRAGEEGFVIDSPVYPEELRALPEVLEQAGFPASGLLDHPRRLGPPARPPGLSRRVAGRRREHGRSAWPASRDALSAGCASSTPSTTWSARSRWRWAACRRCPCPASSSSARGTRSSSTAADGHTADGTAYWLPWLRLLVCGDYLSPVEIPMLSPGGGLDAYRATLERLAPLVAAAEWVVPGHGSPQSGEQAGGDPRRGPRLPDRAGRGPVRRRAPRRSALDRPGAHPRREPARL